LCHSNLSVPQIFVETIHQFIFIYFNSLALFGIEFFHILVWILSIHWIFVILLLLHLVLPSAILGHDWSTRNLHVIDDKLVSKERILLVLTREVLYGNKHFSDLLEDCVLFVYSFVNHHLIRFIWCEQQLLQSCQLVNISWCIFADTCSIHLCSLTWIIANTGVASSSVLE